MKKMCEVELGIDTLSCYYRLTPGQKTDIIKRLKDLPDFRTDQNYWENTHIYRSDCFAEQGVKLVVSRMNGKPWGLLVVIHPTLVLGEADRGALYLPGKKREYKSIVEQADQRLKQVEIPCSIDDMKLYRCDVTKNMIFDTTAEVDEYIRILKKSCLLPRYRWDKFRKNEHKAKDCKAANQHSCKQHCKSAAFFAYDKTAQLEMIDAFPDTLIGKRVLRLEAQLRRKAMKKWAGKDTMDSSNWAVIKALRKDMGEILDWYLKRMQPVEGDYLRYQDAVKIVSQVKGKKARERMLYLLQKTSDSDTLTAALGKLQRKYDLSRNQCRPVLKRFEKLEISPITLANGSRIERLPGFMNAEDHKRVNCA